MSANRIIGAVRRNFAELAFESGYCYDNIENDILLTCIKVTIEKEEIYFEYVEWLLFISFLKICNIEDFTPTSEMKKNFHVQKSSNNDFLLQYAHGRYSESPKSILIKNATWNKLVEKWHYPSSDLEIIESVADVANKALDDVSMLVFRNLKSKDEFDKDEIEIILEQDFPWSDIKQELKNVDSDYVYEVIEEIKKMQPEIIVDKIWNLIGTYYM